MKIGLLLGSFDPIHAGHIYMATQALNNNFVDKVLFVPTYQNPWKSNSTDFDKRCFMVQLALENVSNCYLSLIETKTTHPHYTSNTLKLLKKQYPNDELFLIVGVDTVLSIKDWYEGNWILDNINIISVQREGFEEYKESDIKNTIPVSSTEIREYIKQNKQVYPLIDKAVEEYIIKNKLYE